MTRVEFQPGLPHATGSQSPGTSREAQASAETFRTLLALLQQKQYLQTEASLANGDASPAPLLAALLQTEAAGAMESASALTPSSDSAGLGSLLAAAALLRAEANRTGEAGSGLGLLSGTSFGAGPTANLGGLRSLGTAAYKAQTMERFQELKPWFVIAERETGVPWQIQAAQWALETGWGRSTPKDQRTGQESHNLFGVKGSGPAGSVTAATTEYVDGELVATTAQFRAYRSEGESILEHARLLTEPHYAKALACGRDLKAWTEQLGPENLGYATDPDYSQKLWKIITDNGWDR